MRLPYPIQKTADLLLAELQHIGREIAQLRSDIKEYRDAKADTDKTQEAQKTPPEEVLATVDLPHGVETRKSASDKTEESGHQNRALLVAVLTLIGVAIYAGVAILQWQEMITATGAAQQAVQESRLNRQQSEKSLNAAIDQFKLDQRAWLGAIEMRPPVDLEAGKIAKFGMLIMNSGKTPGIHFTSRTAIEVVKKGDKFHATYPKRTIGISSVTVLQPSMKIEIWIPLSRPITQPEIDELKSGEYSFYIFGTLNYEDVFHRTHWTHVCMVLRQDLKTEDTCDTYNEVDSNQ